MWKGIISLNDISAPLNCAFTIPKICSLSHDSWSSTKGRLPTPKNSALSGFIYSIFLPFCAHFTICEMPSSTSGRRDPFHVCLTYFQPEEKDLSEYLLCWRILMTNPPALLIRDGNSKKARWQTVSQLINFYSFGDNYWIFYQRSRLVSRNFLLALSKRMPPKIPGFKFFGKLVH